MPLLEVEQSKNLAWPPAPHDRVRDTCAEVSAWWLGSQDRLDGIYGGNASSHGSRYGGVIGKIGRWLWGTRSEPTDPASRRVHVTLAADIIEGNKKLLFGDPVSFGYLGDSPEAIEAKKERAELDAAVKDAKNPFTPGGVNPPAEPSEGDGGQTGGQNDPTGAPGGGGDIPDRAGAAEPPGLNNPTPPEAPAEPEEEPGESQAARDRLDLIFNSKLMHSAFQTASTLQAAYGGVYGRIVVDPTVRKHAWLDFVDADRAIPEFKWDQLVAVTFWTVLSPLSSDKGAVYRHLEKHEPGWVYHGLYKGTAAELGQQVAWDDHPQMRDLEVSDPAQGRDATGLPEGDEDEIGQLAVGYIPNLAMNPEWREDIELRPLGRPDITPAAMGLLDVLDEVYTSLLRDVRIGKGRIIAMGQVLQAQGPGKGATFDLDQEVFTTIPGDPNAPLIQAQQFDIRVQDHLDFATDLSQQIVRACGYSPFTYGLEDDQATAMTATEVESKEKDTFVTRKSKITAWMVFLETMVPRVMRVDEFFFPQDGAAPEEDDSLQIQWPPMARDSIQVTSEWVSTLKTATLISNYLAIKTLHPEFDDEEIQVEIDRIKEDTPAAPADPLGIGEEATLTDPADTEDPDAPPAPPQNPPPAPVRVVPAAFT